MKSEEAIKLLTEESGISHASKGYFFSNTFLENNLRMSILRKIAEEMTEKLTRTPESESLTGRLIFWGSTYDMFVYLLFVQYDEVEKFLNFIRKIKEEKVEIKETNDFYNHFRVAKLFIKPKECKIVVVFNIVNEKLLPLEDIVKSYFLKNEGFEIKINENE